MNHRRTCSTRTLFHYLIFWSRLFSSLSFVFPIWAFAVARRRRCRRQVDDQVAAKIKARAELLTEYVSDSFPKAEVERVLDSIADANNYIAFNVAPVER